MAARSELSCWLTQMQVLGDGGAIYTLGTQGGLPFSHIPNTSAVLAPSVQARNFIHDCGNASSAQQDHGGIGEGSHGPGALYADEGSTNWNITHNVIQDAPVWLQGCRPGASWIGPLWQNYNWFDAASAASINVEARCPLVGDELINGTAWPEEAVAVMQEAGPRSRT